MIGIVMLTYNRWDLTIDCVYSIKNTTKGSYKIYIVDNASPQRPSEDFLNEILTFQNVEIIYNKNNAGYSAGNNIGIKKAFEDDCDEVLITNNDVIFSNGCIDGLKYALNEDNTIGIVGPKVYLPDGSMQEINMGCKMTMSGKYKYILRKTPLAFLTKNFVEQFHAVHKDKEKPFDVYGVSGCCFMMSRACSRRMYPLDEHTFLFEEENILSNKMEINHFRTVYYSPCTIVHLGGGSTEDVTEFAYTCLVASEQYYCREILKANRFKTFPLFMIRCLVYLRTYPIKRFGLFCKNVFGGKSK